MSVTVNFDNNSSYDILDALANAFDKKVIRSAVEHSLSIPASKGMGFISANCFQDGISILILDINLKQPLTLTFEDVETPPIFFFYTLVGSVRHSLNDDDGKYEMGKLEGSISACHSNKGQKFQIPGQEQVKAVLVAINRIHYLAKVNNYLSITPPRLKDVLMDVQGENSFLYHFTITVNLHRALEQMIDCQFKAIIKATYLEAKVLEVLALQFRFYVKDTSPDTKFINIREDDLKRILKAREILDKDLRNPPTIPVLAKSVGVNVNKLKRGFKQVFDITINKYVTQERLEKARDLLLGGKLTVAQVCFEIGYDNGSYFARIFKKRYGKHPSEVIQSSKIDVAEFDLV